MIDDPTTAQAILLEAGWTPTPSGVWVDQDGCRWQENEALKAQSLRDHFNGIVWKRVKREAA